MPFATVPVKVLSARLIEPSVPETVPFAIHMLVAEESENFRMPPPLAAVLSSAIYTVSNPGTVGLRSAKKNEYGLDRFAEMPGNCAIVWPETVGSPVPTVPSRTAVPDAVDTYSCPPKIPACRRLVTVVLNDVEVVAPKAA